MKYSYSVLLLSMLAVFSGDISAQGIINFNNSPNNWVNSPNNFDNSSNNWVNSPNNFNNSPNNFSATNGVYDNRGNRIGYESLLHRELSITLITAEIVLVISQASDQLLDIQGIVLALPFLQTLGSNNPHDIA